MTEKDILLSQSYAVEVLQGELVQLRDLSHELQGDCLLDCAKILMATNNRKLTIAMMRAGSVEEALSVLAGLHSEFLDPTAFEPEFYPSALMPSSTWIIHTHAGSREDTVLGTLRAPVILLLILEYDPCAGIDPDAEFCQDADVPYEAETVLAIAELQLGKLAANGYPP